VVGVVVVLPNRELPVVVVVFPNRELPVVVGLLPNRELPVVVEPKMLLPEPAPVVVDCPPSVVPPKLPVDAAVAGVPRPMKSDMVAVGYAVSPWNCWLGR
jgi:hypothetical protein